MKKPKIGELCNGCGLCCRSRVCANGSYTLGLVRELGETADGPCPAIVVDDNGAVQCGIIINPKKYIKDNKYSAEVLSRNFAKAVGAGIGCDELGDNPTEEDEKDLDDLIRRVESSSDFERKMKVVVKVLYNL